MPRDLKAGRHSISNHLISGKSSEGSEKMSLGKLLQSLPPPPSLLAWSEKSLVVVLTIFNYSTENPPINKSRLHLGNSVCLNKIITRHTAHLKLRVFPWVSDFFIVLSPFAKPRGFSPIHEVPRRNHHNTMRSLHLVVVTLHNTAWCSKPVV
jgi:hypothetical protein